MKIEISDVNLGELEDFASRLLNEINESLDSLQCPTLGADTYAAALERTLDGEFLVFPIHDERMIHYRVFIEKVPQC